MKGKRWSLSFGKASGKGWMGPCGTYSRKRDAIRAAVSKADSFRRSADDPVFFLVTEVPVGDGKEGETGHVGRNRK